MPKPPLPPEVDRMLRNANPAVIATLRADGSPHTAATWYDWDGERILVNMDATRLRLKNMRRDPRISLTVMNGGDWYRHVTLFGHVVEIRDDPEFKDIDRLSLRYTRWPFHNQLRARLSALIAIDSWYGWEGSTSWPPGA
jgi:PPOX class probable F420-dependent enzyme